MASWILLSYINIIIIIFKAKVFEYFEETNNNIISIIIKLYNIQSIELQTILCCLLWMISSIKEYNNLFTNQKQLITLLVHSLRTCNYDLKIRICSALWNICLICIFNYIFIYFIFS